MGAVWITEDRVYLNTTSSTITWEGTVRLNDGRLYRCSLTESLNTKAQRQKSVFYCYPIDEGDITAEMLDSLFRIARNALCNAPERTAQNVSIGATATKVTMSLQKQESSLRFGTVLAILIKSILYALFIPGFIYLIVYQFTGDRLASVLWGCFVLILVFAAIRLKILK